MLIVFERIFFIKISIGKCVQHVYKLLFHVLENVHNFFFNAASTVNEAWKYEKIYDSASVIKMEGFNNPFGSKERDIKLDHKKLQLEYALGKLFKLFSNLV